MRTAASGTAASATASRRWSRRSKRPTATSATSCTGRETTAATAAASVSASDWKIVPASAGFRFKNRPEMLYILDFVAFGIVFTAAVIGLAFLYKALRPFLADFHQIWAAIFAALPNYSDLTLIFDKEEREEQRWRAWLNKPVAPTEPDIDWQRYEDQVEAHFLKVGDNYAPFSPYDQWQLAQKCVIRACKQCGLDRWAQYVDHNGVCIKCRQPKKSKRAGTSKSVRRDFDTTAAMIEYVNALQGRKRHGTSNHYR